ncbi:hypothetical protein N8491_03265 [Akkermansiaceae bacterium]|nr:hypothetical protein [Akkermansiaceae bacterium]
MRSIFKIAFSLFLAIPVFAKENPKFAGIEWSFSKAQVKIALAKKGYRFEKEVKTPKQVPNGRASFDVFKGSIAGKDVQVEVEYSPQSEINTVKVIFDQLTNGTGPNVYAEIKRTLVRKYGKPDTDKESPVNQSCKWVYDPQRPFYGDAQLSVLYTKPNRFASLQISQLSVTYIAPRVIKKWLLRHRQKEAKSNKEDL